MRFLIDTQLTLWIPSGDARVSSKMLRLLEEDENEFIFSTVSLWEIAIKRSLGRADFQIDPRGVRRQLLRAGYEELPVLGEHAMAVDTIPFHSQRSLRPAPDCAGNGRRDHAFDG